MCSACFTFRTEYARWKEDCRQMFPVVGSGRFITAPVITDDGQPIQDPIVLMQINPDRGQALSSEENFKANGHTLNPASALEPVKDKKIIQWLLTLHQIGW